MPMTLLGPVVLLTPMLLFALGGILLWRRHHSVPTMLIAVGFIATFVAQLEGAVRRLRLGASGAEKLCALGATGRFCAAPQLHR